MRVDAMLYQNKCSSITIMVHEYSTETDGHRPIGRPWHASPWKNSSMVKVISLSIRNTVPFPHPKMIHSHLPLTIPCWCLCLNTLTPDLILAGRSHPRNGQLYSSVSSRENRSVTSRVIMVCPMRRFVVCCGLRVTIKRDV